MNEIINVTSPSCGMARELNTIYRDQSKYYVGNNVVLYWHPLKKKTKKTQKAVLYMLTHYLGIGKEYMLLAPLFWDG